MRKFVDALAFVALVAVGCIWSMTAFGQAGPGIITGTGYPQGAQPAVGSSTGTTAGTTAVLPGGTSRLIYMCGFSVSPGSATAATVISVTFSNLAVGQTYFVGAPAVAAGAQGAPLIVNFAPCVQGFQAGNSISVIAGALGAGGINQAVNVWGYTVPVN